MEIRELNIEDVERISEIEKESFLANWEKRLYEEIVKTKTYFGYGIYVNKILEGYIFILDTFDAEEIVKIAISKKMRRKGLASKLLLFMIENQKREQFFLEVRESNINAINLYLKMGFEKISIRKNYYKDTKENAIIMRKTRNHKRQIL